MTAAATSGHAAQRFEALDGWRGICALMVVLFHAPVESGLLQFGVVRHAFLFVDFFFVLSGFVIAHAFAQRLAGERRLGAFLANRLRRVYPLHLFMLALFVAFELLLLAMRGPQGAFQGGNSPSALLSNLLMIHSLGAVDALGWNYPSWSISAELVSYLLFGLVMVLVPRLALVVFALVIPVALGVLFARVGHLDTTIGYGWLRCLLGFGLGVLLRQAVWPRLGGNEAGGPSTISWTVAECACVLAVGLFVARAGLSTLSLAAPFVFAFAIFVFAHEGGAISRLLRSTPIAFLGLVSYSIYMTHAFVISRLVNVGTVLESVLGVPLMRELPDGAKVLAFGEIAGAVAILAIVAGTLIVSALTWRFVERPGQRLFLARGRRVEAVAAE